MFLSFIGLLYGLGGGGRFLMSILVPPFLNLVVPKDGKKGPPRFWDTGWQGLPMDNNIDEKLLPTEFIELWIPVEKTREVMVTLRRFYEKGGWKATGTFAFEIYTAKKSKCWLSPSYRGDMVRVDIFWFARNKANPVTDFFPQYWEVLKPFDFMQHWGKYLAYDRKDPDAWVDHFKKRTPRWDDFMQIRQTMDPKQIFVTDYWVKHLGIQKACASAEMPA